MTTFSPAEQYGQVRMTCSRPTRSNFDKIFSAQTQELGLLGFDHRRPTRRTWFPQVLLPQNSLRVRSKSRIRSCRHLRSLRHAQRPLRFAMVLRSRRTQVRARIGDRYSCGLPSTALRKCNSVRPRANGDEGAALRRATEAALQRLRRDVRRCDGRVRRRAPTGRPPARPPARATGGLRGEPHSYGPPRNARECRRLDTGHARPHRKRTEERPLRDGRGAVPLGDVAGDPRAARRVPDDHRPPGAA